MTPMQCRMARAALRLTVRSLASKMNMATSTLTLFENNRKTHHLTIDSIEQYFLDTGQIQFLGEEGIFVTSTETLKNKARKKASGRMDNAPTANKLVEEDVRSSLPANIKRLRKEMGLSQARLSCRLDADNSYINRIENGLLTPSLVMLIKIADALGSNVTQLLERHQENA